MPIPLKQKVKNYEGTLVNQLINYVENPDSLGFIDGLWYSPKYDKRYSPAAHDKNNFGEGIDRNENEYVKNGELKFHKDALGREYITPEEERNTRHHVLANAEESYGNRLKFAQKTMNSSKTPSEMKKALTMSAIYNLGAGTVSNELFENKALMDSLLNGSDLGYSDQVNRYYVKHGVPSRGPKTNQFVEQYVPVQQDAKIERKPYFSNLKERLNNAFQEAVNAGSRTNSRAYGGNVNIWGLGGNQKAWRQKHQSQWYSFLKRKGLNDADASRLSGFFTAQDGLESAGGKSAAAREKNNYGGMQRGGKNIAYGSVSDYMEDKWRMMNNRFRHALGAKNIDEFATALGNPDLAGKNYLYYVTDKAKYNPQSSAWRNAQTQHMHNYINGMRAWAGMPTVRFNDAVAKPVGQDTRERAQERYGNYENTPVFMPKNPEAFFAPLSTYTRPVVVEPEQPLIDLAALQAQEQREAERQQRRDGLNLLLGLLGNNGGNRYFSMLSPLLGG